MRALLKSDDSVLWDSTLAYDLFNSLILPKDWKDMEGWSNQKLIEQVMLSDVQVFSFCFPFPF